MAKNAPPGRRRALRRQGLTPAPAAFDALERRLLLSGEAVFGTAAAMGAPAGTAQINGSVWEDLDGDGLWDAGEPGLSGWTVFLDENGNGLLDAGETSAATGADGGYSFDGVGGGTYYVTEQIQQGWVRRFPDSPSEGRTFTDINAALPGVYECAIDWGDYDGDGDLDLAVLGWTGSEAITAIYRNDDIGFTDIEADLPPMRDGALAWGDYDNDGDVDLVLTGKNGGGPKAAIFRNDAGSFNDADAPLTPVDNSAVAWGDYDNDGDLDLVVAGFDGTVAVTNIYRNDAGTFTDIHAGIEGVHHGAVSWGDYESDGDLDLLLGGRTTGGGQITRIYRNTSGAFVEFDAGLPGVDYAAVAWSDYDGDGDPDVALAGNSSEGRIARIYRNDGSAFADIGAPLPGVGGTSLAWGDYDLDGRADLAITGYAGGGQRISRVYRNNGGDAFADTHAVLTGVNGSSLAWDDIDADGYPDIALAGYSASGAVTTIYHNVAMPGPHVIDIVDGETANGLNFGNYRPGTIEGVKWRDLNGDGIRDTDDAGLGGWTIYLDTNGNEAIDPWEPGSLTDGSGAFRFGNLAPGTYVVREVGKSGWVLSAPGDGYLPAAVTSGQTVSGLEFVGYQLSRVGGGVWEDLNADGVRGAGEPGLEGWTVYLDTNDDAQRQAGEPARITDSDGAYVFADLQPGAYTVRHVVQGDWQQSSPADGHFSVAPASGDVIEHLDFGEYRFSGLCGTVWNDKNADGVRDAGEGALPGWTVFLDVNGNGTLDGDEPRQDTGAAGEYSFGDLRPGSHTVAEVVQGRWEAISPPGGTAGVSLTSGQTDVADFANRLPGTEVAVFQGAVEISDGQSNPVDFGTLTQGEEARELTFTITNVADEDLTVAAVQLTSNSGFEVIQQPGATVASGGGSTTFTLRMQAVAIGVNSAQVSFANNDTNENPFDFRVQGATLNAPPVAQAGDDLSAQTSRETNFTGSFSDTGADQTHSVNWDFGDGRQAPDTLAPSHTYAEAGSYTVTLTVTDSEGGVGTDSLVVTVVAPPAPSAPAGVAASDGTFADRVRVTWGSVPGATGYEVWRHASDDSGPAGLTASVTGTSWDDTSAASGQVYYYWLKATNAGGASDFSESDAGYRPLAPQPQLVPHAQDFSSTRPDASAGWEYYSTNEGRIEAVDGRLRLDDTTDNDTYSLNEAILHLDLTGMSQVVLIVDHVTSGDAGDPLPAGFVAHADGDGIAISADGTTWYRLADLTDGFTAREFDLDAAAASAGIGYTWDFQIKFQQYGGGPWGSGGRAFDNILVVTAAPLSGWQQVGIGDFNNDGQDDMLWRNINTNGFGVSLISRGRCMGWLSMQTVSHAKWEIGGVGDFNNDGHDDILWRNRNTGRLGAWLMDGSEYTGWLDMQAVSQDDWSPGGVGDFNGDGHADILWRNRHTGSIGARLMVGGQRIGWLDIGTASYDQWGLGDFGDMALGGAGDFDGDGCADVLWRNRATGQTGVSLLQDGQYAGWLGMETTSYAKWELLGPGDFNGDGDVDVLWRKRGTGVLGAWLMDAGLYAGWLDMATIPQGDWALGAIGGAGSDLELGGVGDFDGNGHADILWRNRNSGAVGVWLMNAGRRIGWVNMQTVSYADWELGAIADFNNDGHMDILWRNRNSDHLGAWLMDRGRHTGWLGMAPASYADLELAGVGDFDGDGHVDILLRNRDTGILGARLTRGGQEIGWLAMQTVSYAKWSCGGLGDFNNDAQVDILWRGRDDNRLGAWLMDAGAYTGWWSMGTVSTALWEIGGLGDFNGDGHVDILWRNMDTGLLGAWLMRNGYRVDWLGMDI